jgi:hypothetical protein
LLGVFLIEQHFTPVEILNAALLLFTLHVRTGHSLLMSSHGMHKLYPEIRTGAELAAKEKRRFKSATE